jgi:hypothetical protein
MNKLIITMSTKGGVGKSFMAKLIYQSMLDAHPTREVVLVDADANVRALSRSYPNALTFDLSDIAQRADLAQLGKVHKGKDIIIDMAGGTVKQLHELMSGMENPGMFFRMFKNNGYQPIIVVPITSTLFSNEALREIEKEFGEYADFFIVKNMVGVENEKTGYARYFKIFEGTLEDREQHPILKDYVPVEFAQKNMGLDVNTDADGTSTNSFRLPHMPIELSAWIDDSRPFSQEFINTLPDFPQDYANVYFDKAKGRLLKTDLLKFDDVATKNGGV